MGKIKLYKAGLACQALQTNPSDASVANFKATHDFKDTSGNTCNGLMWNTTGTNQLINSAKALQYYSDLTGYVSADTETDFSLDHYARREISNITYTRSNTAQTGGRIYTLQITNGNSAEISVGSIKFEKMIFALKSGSSSSVTCLIFGYFFDTPVTIPAGGTKTFVVNFDS